MTFNVGELERILEQRKTELQTLAKRREEVQAELNKLDREIQDLIGDGRGLGSLRRRRRKRPANERSLRAVVLEILGKKKAGFKLADLAGQVTGTGYKSNSRNFRNVLYQCLYNTEGIKHDSETGCYKLAK